MQTAEEFLDKRIFDPLSIPDTMIEFAKLHVQEALKSASENAETKDIEVYTGGLDGSGVIYETMQEIDKESILNAYDLSNIK